MSVSIWAKIISNHRVVKGIIFDSDETLTYTNFFKFIEKICGMLKCATPVLLTKHFNEFEMFNTTKFKSGDFIEEIGFDKLVLENAIKDWQ